MSRSTGGWVAGEVGDQRGRTAVVTGANTGIGFETAAVLAAHGATVVLACRDAGRAAAAAARMAAAAARMAGAVPDAAVDPLGLDLASLASVRRAADRIRSRYPRLDLLINNAGLMMPRFGRTEDGFELQFGTNHLGHFALTGLLLDRLLPTPGSRIVTVGSLVHRGGRIHFDDLNFARRRYRRPAAYSQSKLANLMFTLELQRRLAAAAARPVALAAEPGLVPTELPRHAAAPARLAVWLLTRLAGQPDAATGALATLRAATDPRASGGEYYGPDGRLLRTSGHPVRIEPGGRARDPRAQRRLWAESERLTGVTYRFGGPD